MLLAFFAGIRNDTPTKCEITGFGANHEIFGLFCEAGIRGCRI